MAVTVRFFASLREQIGYAERTLDAVPVSIAAAWEEAAGGRELPPNLLAAVNMEYVDLDHVVVDGDEVAFFPPVTGG